MRSITRFLVWPVLSGLLAATLILLAFPELYRESPATPATAVSPLPGPTDRGFAAAVQAAAPSVVNIYTRRVVQEPAVPLNDPVLRYFFGNRLPARERVEQSLGSGVILREDGYILTNRHVIADASDILVLLKDGREALATVVGEDADTDLAVLKVALDDLSPIAVADPAAAHVGDIVLAIGNPYGFGHSVSQGIISATGRHGLRLTRFENFIQTDAAINPGNSGGALIDVHGRLLGINTAIQSETGGFQGIGLATPVDTAQRVMGDLIEHGYVVRGWIGVDAQELTPALARALNSDIDHGLVITYVHPDGPADRAGVHAGDILLAIDDTPLTSGQTGLHLVAWRRPGDTVRLTVFRDGATQRLDATVIQEPIKAGS